MRSRTKKIRILGIESSCDETSVAIVEKDQDGEIHILSNIVKSQLDVHSSYGGVVPELAARAHSDIIDELILMALKKAKVKLDQLDAIASTSGPGLLGGLLVGMVSGKTLSSVLNVPFIAINHLEGHALSVLLEQKIDFPYLLLLVSGGHTEFTIINKFNSYERIGTTVDDAVGEAFDKTARILNLNYPGGPEIEKYALKGNALAFKLPQPLIHEKNCHFSFSGLKSAVAQVAAKNKIDAKFKKDMAASFQKTIAEILKIKTKNAIQLFRLKHKKSLTNIIVAGGVAANQYLRKELLSMEDKYNCEFYFPSMKLCTDNGAMIALAGLERYERKLFNKLTFKPRPRWPLDKKAVFMKGKRAVGI